MTLFFIALTQVMIFAVYTVIGIFAAWRGIIDKNALNLLSKLITRILMPCMIFMNLLTGSSRSQILNAGAMIPMTLIFDVVLFLCAEALIRAYHLPPEKRGVFRMSFIIGNSGFMGFPLIAEMYPQGGLLFASVFFVMDQIYGNGFLLPFLSPQPSKRVSPLELFRRMMSTPIMIAVVLGIGAMLLDLRLPEILTVSLTKIGGAASPLAMLYLGALFFLSPEARDFKHPEFLWTLVLRLLVLPVVLGRLMFFFLPDIPELAVMVPVLFCAMPTGVAISVFARNAGADSEYSASLIMLTTIVSVFTIPLVCLLIR